MLALPVQLSNLLVDRFFFFCRNFVQLYFRSIFNQLAISLITFVAAPYNFNSINRNSTSGVIYGSRRTTPNWMSFDCAFLYPLLITITNI